MHLRIHAFEPAHETWLLNLAPGPVDPFGRSSMTQNHSRRRGSYEQRLAHGLLLSGHKSRKIR
jgi:hypothetical protein